MRAFNTKLIPKPRTTVMAPNGPFDLEIGAGVGLHPIVYAKENPERTLVAIERTQEKFEKFLRRHQKHPSLTNLIPVHADAIHWVTHCVAPNSLERIFILYPNPESKNKNQRFSNMPFTPFLVSKMLMGGELILATNIEEYANECETQFETFGLELVERGPCLQPGRTHFERKYLERGESCYNLLFKRVK